MDREQAELTLANQEGLEPQKQPLSLVKRTPQEEWEALRPRLLASRTAYLEAKRAYVAVIDDDARAAVAAGDAEADRLSAERIAARQAEETACQKIAVFQAEMTSKAAVLLRRLNAARTAVHRANGRNPLQAAGQDNTEQKPVRYCYVCRFPGVDRGRECPVRTTHPV